MRPRGTAGDDVDADVDPTRRSAAATSSWVRLPAPGAAANFARQLMAHVPHSATPGADDDGFARRSRPWEDLIVVFWEEKARGLGHCQRRIPPDGV